MPPRREKRGRKKDMKYVLIGDEGGSLESGCRGSDAAQITSGESGMDGGTT